MKLCLGVLAAIIAACGSTTIRESHVLQAHQANNEIAYYRVRIDGNANLAKTSYRAGLYDAEALDALTTAVDASDQNAVDATLERRRREAVDKLAAKFYQALENGDTEEADKLRRSLASALQSPWVAAAIGSDTELLRPRRKYAIIFSAIASVVEEAIANFAEEKETEDLVLSAFAGLNRTKLIDATVDKERLDASLKRLRSVEQAATALQPTTEGYADSVRRLLEDVASVPPR